MRKKELIRKVLSLEVEIKNLLQKVRQSDYSITVFKKHNIPPYGPFNPYLQEYSFEDVRVKDVVFKILQHLNLDIEVIHPKDKSVKLIPVGVKKTVDIDKL